VRHYSADKDIDSKVLTNVVVSSDGKCKWIPPGLFESSCAIDISWFPYDEQVCFLKFGSWTYNGFQLDLRLSKDTFDLTNYVSNGEWELLGTAIVRVRPLSTVGYTSLVASVIHSRQWSN